MLNTIHQVIDNLPGSVLESEMKSLVPYVAPDEKIEIQKIKQASIPELALLTGNMNESNFDCR